MAKNARVESFSDGVFTIAITLLVLEIKVPQEIHNNSLLVKALLKEWPMFAAYLTSFATIGMLWMSHHYLFKFIEKSDHLLYYINLLVLLLVTFVPFPTALLAEYLGTPGETIATMIYAGTFFAISIAFLLLWRHASKGRRLIGYDLETSLVRGITRAYRIRPLFRLIALVLAFVNTYVSLALTLALAIVYAVPPKHHFKSPRLPSR